MEQDSRNLKTVFITGASSGIGESCALYLDRRGWRVFASVRKPVDAEQLRSRSSSNLTPLLMDVTDEASVTSAAATITETLGVAGLDGLVNNAGIALPGIIEFMHLPDLRRQLEVNLVGQIAVTQAVLPLLRRNFGRIINISSTSGLIAYPFFGPYTASKFALEAISDALRLELRPWAIKVIVIEPGSVVTPIWEKSLRSTEERIMRLPVKALPLYAEYIDRVRQMTISIGKAGISSETVSKMIELALISKHPKARYVVGLRTRLMVLVGRLAPVRLRDWFIAKQLGLDNKDQ